jgi:acetyl-CoA carboxylase alpha subunit
LNPEALAIERAAATYANPVSVETERAKIEAETKKIEAEIVRLVDAFAAVRTARSPNRGIFESLPEGVSTKIRPFAGDDVQSWLSEK